MATLGEVWERLRGVRALRFEASSGAATGWTGVGTGEVAVAEGPGDSLVFTEAGAWQPARAGAPAIRFSNVYRWTRSGGALRLEHLRFGADRPVFLFEMVEQADGAWREAAAHQCERDCYAAELAIGGDLVRLAWTVSGPEKRESIRYTYW